MSFLWLDKGHISPKMCIPRVRVKTNKRSFEPFCVWILFQNASSHSVSDLCCRRAFGNIRLLIQGKLEAQQTLLADLIAHGESQVDLKSEV